MGLGRQFLIYTDRAIKRFFSRINKRSPNDCWEWTGHKTKLGYGKISEYSKYYAAHRVSYFLHLGPFNRNLFVCHSCDNRCCVNPSHLFLGTREDNYQDMLIKNRQTKKLTPQQVKEIRTKYGPKTSCEDKVLISRFKRPEVD